MKAKRLSVNLSLVLGALLAIATLAAAARANHSWNNYHWARTSNPFTLKVGDNVTGSWDTHLSTAVTDWSRANEFDLAKVAGSSNKRCAMVTGTVQVCAGNYGFNGWLGLASINITGGQHITQGSAKMNDSYFNSSTYNNPNEKLHVMCQEVGHTFGLGHTSEDGSSQNTCMDYFSNTGANATSTTSTHPNSHDYQELSSIYSHLDTTTTVGSFSAFNLLPSDEVTNDPNSWGRLMSQSANGRSSTYEKELSNGSRTITHVFWSLEAAERCQNCDHRFEH
jgi:hypothetical protein